MKAITVCFSYILAFSCAGNTAFAGNVHCGSFRVQQYHAPKAVAVYQPYQVFAAVGYSTQIEAEVTRAQKPLVAELQAVRAENANILQTLNALRTEQKASFANIFKFKGQGTITFDGDGGGDVPPVNPPKPVDPTPQPTGDRSPPLTQYMRQLLTTTCAACHDGQKEAAFVPDANGTLEDHRPGTPDINLASDIFGRIHSAKPTHKKPDGTTGPYMMPPTGSTEEMRNGVNDWFIQAAKRQMVPDFQEEK